MIGMDRFYNLIFKDFNFGYMWVKESIDDKYIKKMIFLIVSFLITMILKVVL